MNITWTKNARFRPIKGKIITLILLIGWLGLQAQEREKEIRPERELLGTRDLKIPKNLDKEEVFSAIRSNKKVGDLPLNIYIISRAEIIRGNYTTLSDVLKNVPGLRVSQPGSAGNGDMFLMGGLLGNVYTKILLNGLFLQNAATGSFPLGGQLPIRQAQRIEIIFGPASALYGADAMVGVINIITQVSEETSYGQVDFLGGDQAGYHFSSLVGGKLGKNDHILNYQIMANGGGRQGLQVFQEESDAFNPLTYFAPAVQNITNEDSLLTNFYPPNYLGTSTEPIIRDLPQQDYMFGIQAQYRGFQASYTRMSRRQHSSVGLSPLYYHYANSRSYYGETLDRATLSFETGENQWHSQTNLSYTRVRVDPNSSLSTTFRFPNNGLTYMFAASDEIFLEELCTYRPSKNIEFTGGVFGQFSGVLPIFNNLIAPFDPQNYRPFSENDAGETNIPNAENFNSIRYFTVGGFLQAYATRGPLTAILGGRIDQNTYYGRSVNPRLALQYKFSPIFSAKASVGTAFRGPVNSLVSNSFPLGVVEPRDSLLIGGIPSNVLRPESYFSTDLGLYLKPTENLSIELTGAFQSMSNLIEFAIEEGIQSSALDSVRTTNSNDAGMQLFTAQLMIRSVNLIPEIGLGGEISVNYSTGTEVVTNLEQILRITTEIDGVRQIAPWVSRVKLFAEPIENFTIQTYLTWMSASTPNAISRRELEQGEIELNPGSFNIDLSFNISLSANIQVNLTGYNLTNALITGLEASSGQIALRGNPQLGRQIRIGCSIIL